MKHYLAFFFIFLAGLAGLISVPSCYVMELDCPERGSVQCLRLAAAGSAAVKNSAVGCCAMASEADRQEPVPGVFGGKILFVTLSYKEVLFGG